MIEKQRIEKRKKPMSVSRREGLIEFLSPIVVHENFS